MMFRPLFATLVAVLFVLAWRADGLGDRLLLASLGTGLIGVGFNYLRGKPGACGKRPDGSVARWAWPLNWFNFALLQAGFRLWRRWNKEDPWNQVDETFPVYVGRRLLERDRAAFEAQARRWAVLDLTSEFAEPSVLRHQEAYLCVAALDGFAPTQAQLATSAAFIREQLAAGRSVYVHCAVGHGRSATAAAAWMLLEGRAANPSEAIAAMTSRRPWVSLSDSQKAALAGYLAGLKRG